MSDGPAPDEPTLSEEGTNTPATAAPESTATGEGAQAEHGDIAAQEISAAESPATAAGASTPVLATTEAAAVAQSTADETSIEPAAVDAAAVTVVVDNETKDEPESKTVTFDADTADGSATRQRNPSFAAMDSRRIRVKKGRFTLEHGFSEYFKLPIVILGLGIATFMFVGVASIGVSGWALSYQGTLAKVLPAAGFNTIICAGFCLVMASTVGMYAALMRSRSFLRVFAYIAAVVMILEVAGGIVTFTWIGDQDAIYISKINAGDHSFTKFESELDANLNTTFAQCCTSASAMAAAAASPPAWGNATDCTFLSVNSMSLSLCDDINQFKSSLLTELIDVVINPLGITALVLLVPQLLCLIATWWLVCRLDPIDHHLKDDVDHNYAAIPVDPTTGLYTENEPDEFPYTFVLVFPAKPPPRANKPKYKQFSMEAIISRLHNAGLFTRLERSTTEEEIFCRISTSRARLELEADRINYKMRLDSEALRLADIKSNKGVRDLSKPGTLLELKDDVGSKRWGPYSYIYAKFDLTHQVGFAAGATPTEADFARGLKLDAGAQKPTFYRRDRFTRSKFRDIDICRLVFSILQGPVKEEPVGAGLALEDLMQKGLLEEYFPLHQPDKLKALKKEWFQWFNGIWDQPFNLIRSYYGEKVALYTAFASHYTKWLLAPAMLGIAVYAHQQAAQDFSVLSLPLFGIFIAVWATVMLEYWKREQHFRAKEWGMGDFEVLEVPRPQFIAHPEVSTVPDPVTGLPEHYYDPKIKRRHVIVSWITITCLIGVVLISVFSIFVLRLFLMKLEREGTLPAASGGKIAALVNAVQIQVLNFVYGRVAIKLNDVENHATETEYEDNLIAKTFCFQFINSYFSLFYIAFIKNNLSLFGEKQECVLNDSGESDCLQELSAQLGVIFVSRLIVGNLTEALVPWAKFWWAERKEHKLAIKEGRGDIVESPAERQNGLADYETFQDYSENVIQFGYVTLFVVAFPLAPFFALVNNYVEIRVDAFKLLHNSCRPDPDGAEDIGTWYRWLQLMGQISVITNLAVVVFVSTSNAMPFDWMTQHPVWTFVILEHLVFLLKLALDWIVPDVPQEVVTQHARQEYLVDKHIFGVGDDVISAEQMGAALHATLDAPGSHDDGSGVKAVEYSATAGPRWANHGMRHRNTAPKNGELLA